MTRRRPTSTAGIYAEAILGTALLAVVWLYALRCGGGLHESWLQAAGTWQP